MTEIWITKAGRFRVGRHECPHPGVPVDLARPRSGVLHTIEGSFDSGLAVFEQHFAPHFIVGPTQILQLVPLGMEATALEHDTDLPFETNRWAVAQIEIEGHSDLDPWLPAAPIRDRLEALMFALKDKAGIPLSRAFPNPLKRGVTWATASNPRRTIQPPRWGVVPGWWMHLEIPGNEHWDAGNIEWDPLLAGAKTAGLRPRWVIRGGAGHIIGKTKPIKRSGAAALARWALTHRKLVRATDDIHYHRTTRH